MSTSKYTVVSFSPTRRLAIRGQSEGMCPICKVKSLDEKGICEICGWPCTVAK